MRLRRDTDGDETLMPVFIFCATFIVIGAFVVTQMAPLFASADRNGDFTVLANYELIGDTGYLLYEPFIGYNVTSANVTDDNTAASDEIFTNETVSDRWVSIVRDYIYESDGELALPAQEGHSDFISIWTEWGPWYNHHIARIVIDYTDIQENIVSGTNQSVTPFQISNGPMEVLIITTQGNETDFSSYLWANTYNICMGQPAEPTDLADSSMWTILGQLMTASLPNVHPIINFMITVPFWSCIGFMVFTIISRMIPFVGGG